MRLDPALADPLPALTGAPGPESLHHVPLAPESVTTLWQENNGSYVTEGVQEQPLDEAGSPGRVGRGSAVSSGTNVCVLIGELCRPRRWHLRALAVSAAMNIILLVCIAAGASKGRDGCTALVQSYPCTYVAILAQVLGVSGGRGGEQEAQLWPRSRAAASWRSDPQTAGTAATVLGCQEGWIGYRGICYYVSWEKGSWESSQRACSSLGASLAVLKREWEVPFLMRLKGSTNSWLGLRRQDGRLVWADDTVYNEMFPVHGQGACAYMSDAAIASSSCSQLRPYICSVALAPL